MQLGTPFLIFDGLIGPCFDKQRHRLCVLVVRGEDERRFPAQPRSRLRAAGSKPAVGAAEQRSQPALDVVRFIRPSDRPDVVLHMGQTRCCSAHQPSRRR